MNRGPLKHKGSFAWPRYSASVRVAVWAVAVVAMSSGPCWGCPDCKDNLLNQPGALEWGFGLSILLLLGTALSLAAGWGIWLARFLRASDGSREVYRAGS
jgi:hypothetical protein